MKTANKHQAPVAPATGTAFEQLDAVLRMLVSGHEKLLALAGEHRRAIAQADAAGLTKCMGAPQQIGLRIAGRAGA